MSEGLGIWFRDGIENILLAIDEANVDVASRFDCREVRIYRMGFAAALSAVALAFGIRWGAEASSGSAKRSERGADDVVPVRFDVVG